MPDRQPLRLQGPGFVLAIKDRCTFLRRPHDLLGLILVLEKLVLKAGAVASINNRAPVDEQLAEIKRITGGNFGRVFDSSVVSFELSIKALETVSEEKAKYFSTVDDW
jgi:hypothetical protein